MFLISKFIKVFCPDKSERTPVEPNECVVNIDLDGVDHVQVFYQDISFLDGLTKAMSGSAKFFEHITRSGKTYFLLIDAIQHVEILSEYEKSDGNDKPGCAVYLRNGDKIHLDKLPDQIDWSGKFIHLGNHFFKIDEIAMICNTPS